ncbi:MAG: HIT domain-containing protein [Rhodospirillales bacterium]|nr:HIT domain-containing protein [Rhodospirillales bacterium]
MTFELDPRLAADTLPVGSLPLCQLRLMNDATFPWLILVPQRAGVSEIFELDNADQQALIGEIARVSRVVSEAFRADKLNVAALGNIVPQLHVHIVARFRGDPVWPAPIWGKAPPRPYAAAAAEDMVRRIGKRLDTLAQPSA